MFPKCVDGSVLDAIEERARAESGASVASTEALEEIGEGDANAEAAEGYSEGEAAVPRRLFDHPAVDRCRPSLDDYPQRVLFDACVSQVLDAVDRLQQSSTTENMDELVRVIWSQASTRQRRIKAGQ